MFRSSSDKATKSGPDDSTNSGSSKLYGSFNKVKPEDLASRFQNNYKKKSSKNEEEKALLLNYQDEQESDDIIQQLSNNAKLAREKRTSSKRSSCISSDTDSTCSRNSTSSNEGLTMRNGNIEKLSTPNKSFLHSQPSSNAGSRCNSFTDLSSLAKSHSTVSLTNNMTTENNKTDEVITAGSLHKSDTFSNSSPHKDAEYEIKQRSAISLYEPNVEITPARKLSLTNLQRASRSSSVDRKTPSSGRQSPVAGSESPPIRRNSALHRHLKNKLSNSSSTSTNDRSESPPSFNNKEMHVPSPAPLIPTTPRSEERL